MTLRTLLEEHFEKVMELGVLVFIFVFATCMLAYCKGNEEMSRWIENGAIIAILARTFGARSSGTVTPPKDEPMP